MIELDITDRFIERDYTAPEFKVGKPVTPTERLILSDKIFKARTITGLYGNRIDYPQDKDYPAGYFKERDIELGNFRTLRFGINEVSPIGADERRIPGTDYFLHYIAENKDLRFIFFTNGNYKMEITSAYDKEILFHTEERRLADINDFEYVILSEILDGFLDYFKPITH